MMQMAGAFAEFERAVPTRNISQGGRLRFVPMHAITQRRAGEYLERARTETVVVQYGRDTGVSAEVNGLYVHSNPAHMRRHDFQFDSSNGRSSGHSKKK